MKAKYGLKAALRLARDFGRGPVLIADLAIEESIPKKFLELILLELKQHGLLQSKKGKGGGYLLARRPAEISVGEVLRVLDGSLTPVPCVSQHGYRPCDECKDPSTCSIRRVMSEVHDATTTILDATSLEQLAKPYAGDLRHRSSLQRYHI
ncbi:MAG TPA: Rrf2 family transcriptional regulator [Polyangiaceae bacterium]|nr:Rrf2 family transcriptional regulator [Polyangiaceae bacterium]